MLPQFQQRRSQVMLDLYAMQVHRHFNFSDHIRSIEHPPPVLHIQNLDREDIRGVLQFFFREKKRRRLFQIRAPPFHHRRDSSQFLHPTPPPTPPPPPPPHPPPPPPPRGPPPRHYSSTFPAETRDSRFRLLVPLHAKSGSRSPQRTQSGRRQAGVRQFHRHLG